MSVTDCATKRVVEDTLVPGLPHPVLGDLVQFTLVYNRVGPMGITVGPWSRAVFVVCTLVILAMLPRWYQQRLNRSRWAVTGFALVIGGAVGNLWDRVFASRGVVDFIDIGIAHHRFFIFNVADIAVSVGACCLAWATLHSRESTRCAST